MCKTLLKKQMKILLRFFLPETTSVCAGSESGLTMGNLSESLVRELMRDVCTGVLAYSCHTISIIAKKIIALFSRLK